VKLAAKYVSLASLLVCCVLVAAWGQDKPATQPSGGSKDKAAMHATHGLVSPWSKLNSLSDEQKNKIIDIHLKANAERKAIDEKEEADVMALLTDAQKAELEKMNAEKKAQAAEKKKSTKEEKGKDKDKDKEKEGGD